MADGELSSESSQRLSAMPHAVCRRLSSSSESGFNSDLSDEHNASPSSVTDEAVQALNGFVVFIQPEYRKLYADSDVKTCKMRINIVEIIRKCY